MRTAGASTADDADSIISIRAEIQEQLWKLCQPGLEADLTTRGNSQGSPFPSNSEQHRVDNSDFKEEPASESVAPDEKGKCTIPWMQQCSQMADTDNNEPIFSHGEADLWTGGRPDIAADLAKSKGQDNSQNVLPGLDPLRSVTVADMDEMDLEDDEPLFSIGSQGTSRNLSSQGSTVLSTLESSQ